MNRLRANSANFKHCVLGLGFLVGSLMYGSGLAPLPDSAKSAYPFSTVCKVTTEDGSTASGVLIADNLVLTYGGSFIELLEQNDPAGGFEVEITSAENGSTASYAVNQVFVEENYLSTVNSRGLDSNRSLQSSVLVLELSRSVSESSAAVVNVNNISSDGFRMIVAYASDLYGSGGSNADKLHATDSGEAVYSEFGQVESRIYHSGDLKGSKEALGAPLFSYYDGVWSVDGILVETDVVDGSCKVASIDSTLSDRLVSILDETGGKLAEADTISSSQDANSSADSAIELHLGYGQLFSIAPEGDVDYHKFVVSGSGNYVIESFGSLDVSGTLLNGSKQLITSDDDSAGSLNYKLDVTLDAGTYYVKTAPYSGEVTGQYGISFSSADETSGDFADSGYSSSSLIPLDANSAVENYQLKTSGEQDYFLLSVDSAGHFILQVDASFDLKARLLSVSSGSVAPFDSSEIEILWDENDDFPGRESSPVLDAFVKAGEYVVVIEARNAGEFGAYELSSDLYTQPLDIVDSADGFGSLATAKEWTPGMLVESEFDKAGDRDSYKFELSGSSQVEINMSSGTDMVWFLYDDELNQIDTSGAAVVDPIIQKTLSGGTYYLVLAAMSESSYTLE